MIFNTLWTILLGVIGGIISSLIVSRVFLIQSEYQDQVRFVDRIIRKVGYISGFLHSAEAILKVSYDHNIQMEKEIKEKGYDSEKEYYAAHTDEDWISKKDVLDVFHQEIAKTTKLIHEDLSDNLVKDTQLNALIRDIVSYVHDVSSIKEYTFSQISQLMKKEQTNYRISRPKKKVYLFADEFTNLQEAELGLIFAKLLMRLGYKVEIPKHVESGRAAISKGCLKYAKKFAEKNVALLADKINKNHPLIGIEPSCILSFRDEYPDLVAPENRNKAR